MDSALTAAAEETPRFFSLTQRIGRLRYFTYTLLAMVACALLLVATYLFALLLPDAAGRLLSTIAFIGIKNLGVPVIVFVLTIRRLHDFNANGWWALTILMPLVTLLFLFIPGSKGNNRFGPAPAPNNSGLSFAAIAIPIALLGFYYSLYGGKRGNASVPAAISAPLKNAPQLPGLKPYGQ